MQCKLCEKKLLEYLYGELSEQDRRLMDRHIEESAPCRQMCRQLQSARQIAASRGEEELPAGLHTRILAHAGEQKEKGKRGLFRAWIFHPAPAGLAVAAIAAMVYVYAIRMEGELPSPGAPKLAVQGYLEQERTSADIGPAKEKREKKGAVPASPLIRKDTAPAAGANGSEMHRQAVDKAGRKAGSSIMADDRRMDGKADALAEADLSEEPVALGARSAATEPRPAARKVEGVSPGDPSMAREAGAPGEKGASLGNSVYGDAEDLDESEKDDPRVPIARIEELTAKGRCGEAMSWMYIYLARSPQEEDKAGRAWMQLARCYERKGNRKGAADAAGNAVRIPSSNVEAERFLKEISSKGD